MTDRPRLIVTLDVERDYGPGWATPGALTFRSVTEALPGPFAALVREFGVRPTYLVSGEVLENPECCAALRSLTDCELGAHLHGEYVAPAATPLALDDPALRIEVMQAEYGAELERAKLGTLTDLFRQQIGRRPASFRAGRFGAGPATGTALRELGYLVDSSVTPHVVWTDRHGAARPDYRGVAPSPYWTDGDLWNARDDGTLLEVPVTIAAPGELSGAAGSDPLWFRPGYTPAAGLLEILDHVVAQAASGGPARPLVMMFHSMELVAGASPYTQTQDEVAAYYAALRAVFARARQLGIESRTLREYYTERVAERPQVRRCDRDWPARSAGAQWSVSLPRPSVEAALERHGVQPWFAYVFGARGERWDNCLAFDWIAENVDRDAPILATGCGVGFNLMWLAERGFDALFGCDIDPKAIAAGRDLASEHGLPLRLWVDDGLAPLALPEQRLAVITAMNWTQLVEGFSLDDFLDRHAPKLRDDGALVFDYIDVAYDQVDNNRYLTSDWGKPEAERAPSEYRTRLSRAQIAASLARHGLRIERVFVEDQLIPKGVVVARRQTAAVVPAVPREPRPRVLAIVDAPGWAHDRKTDNLARVLAPRFEIVKRYQDAVTAADCAAADLIVVYYWRQLAAMPRAAAEIGRSRAKLLLGVCSHNELEGELRAPGLALLRTLPDQVFAHSQLLHDELTAELPGRIWLVPNGVDTTFFTPQQGRAESPILRVGWAGSLTNFGAEMRGYSNYLQPAVAGLDGGVELVTAAREDRLRSAEEMRAFYRSLDVYVCASRREGTPNPCLEAAACGVPLLSTPVGNMPELIEDGVNGFFIERDVADIAARLRQLRDDRSLLARLRPAIQRSIAAWDWRERAEGYAKMFAQRLRDLGREVAAAAPSDLVRA